MTHAKAFVFNFDSIKTNRYGADYVNLFRLSRRVLSHVKMNKQFV